MPWETLWPESARIAVAVGRLSPWLGLVVRRVDHQLKVEGQTVFPEVLLGLVDSCLGVHRSAVRVATDP